MKKLLYSIFTFSLVFALPIAVSAATFNFVPNTDTVAPGDTFNVTVYINPSTDEEITTAKLSTTFPANLMEIVSFVQSEGWMSLIQPGFDALDNDNGILLKTGGFPARVKEQKQFGVITLKAKNVGTATLAIAEDSLLLDTVNNNKFVSSAGATFTIVDPTPVVAPDPEPVVPSAPDPEPVVPSAPDPEPVTTTPESTSSDTDEPTIVLKMEEIEEDAITDEVIADTTIPAENQLAAAAGVETDEDEDGATFMQKYWYLLLVLLLVVVGILVWRRKNNS